MIGATANMSHRAALIIANGELLSSGRMLELAESKHLLALDGAYEKLHSMDLPINGILGDLDSISPESLTRAIQQGINIIKTPDQNYTDLEKAIMHCDQLGLSPIHISAATGLRLDHTLHNIRLLSRYHNPERPIYLHTEREIVFLVKDEQYVYEARQGDKLGILGAPECHISSTGLGYELQNTALSYDKQSSVCNHIAKTPLYLSVNGAALVIHELKP